MMLGEFLNVTICGCNGFVECLYSAPCQTEKVYFLDSWFGTTLTGRSVISLRNVLNLSNVCFSGFARDFYIAPCQTEKVCLFDPCLAKC